jgi:SAM-dependent methyltransferase
MPRMALAPNYLGHDGEYRRRRAQGRTGWDEGEIVRQTLACLDLFLADVPRPSAPTFIELGCGAGDLSLHFAARGFQVTGYDIAPYAIEWAREKAAQQRVNASFITADLTRDLEPLPPPADIVLDGHCLHCIIGPDRLGFLRNARRCLKPTGVFHVNTMCGNPHPPNEDGFDRVSRCIVLRGVATRYFGTAESIVQELIQAGFRIDRQRVIPAQYPGDEDCLLVNARQV